MENGMAIENFTRTLIELLEGDQHPMTQAPLVNGRILAEEISILDFYQSEQLLYEAARKRAEEEFKKKFNKDPIITIILGDEKNCEGDVTKYIKRVWKRIDDCYFDTLMKEINKTLEIGDEKRLKEYIGLLVSELRYKGFSVEYMKSYANYLRLQDPPFEEGMNSFYKRFQEAFYFRVVFRGGADLLKIETFNKDDVEVKKHVMAVRGNQDEQEFYDYKDKVFLIIKKVPAFDKISAKRSAFDMIKLLFAMNLIANSSLDLTIDENTLVYHNESAESVRTYEDCLGNKDYRTTSVNAVGKVYQALDERSKALFASSLTAYGLSLSSRSVEAQFIHLWTAFESLISSYVRIEEVYENLGPLVCRKLKQYCDENGLQYDNCMEEIRFSFNRLYWMRNLISHKNRKHGMMYSALFTMNFYYNAVIDCICDSYQENAPDAETSLEKIFDMYKK